LLVSEDGGAVWPVQDEHERALLEAVAMLFGATVELVKGQVGEGDACDEAVVGVGETSTHARLYAHLTGRTFRQVDQWHEAFDGRELPAVVVVRAARLDSDLIQHLMMLPRGAGPVGIVWGRNDRELRTQVLIRAAAALLDGPGGKPRIDITHSVPSVKLRGSPEFDLLGGRASIKEIHKALARGAGVLTLKGHSFGWNVSLSSPTAVICGIDQPDSQANRQFGPTCLDTGHCDAVGLPVRKAMVAGRIIAPEKITARVLVLASCRTAFIGSGALDNAWSVLPRLLLNPRVGAVLATPEPSTTAYVSISEELSAPLAQGHAISSVLPAYERSSYADHVGHRLLLFGDPRVKAVTGQPQETLSPQSTLTPPRPVSIRGRQDPEVALLREIASSVYPASEAVGRRTSARAMKTLDLFETDPSPQAGNDLREALLEHLRTMRGRPVEGWLGPSDYRRSKKASVCPTCGWKARPFNAVTRSGVARELLICPRCIVALDQPSPSRLRMSVTPDGMVVEGDLPMSNWSAAVILVPTNPAEAQLLPWPRAASGAPEKLFRWEPHVWPKGPLEVRGVFIGGTQVDSVGALARAVRVSHEADVQDAGGLGLWEVCVSSAAAAR
jgi:hypothetical protein